MLCEIAQLHPFGEADFPFLRRQFARQQLDQRRFASAVAAQQTDARARHQVQLDRIENHTIAIARGDLFHIQQRVRQVFRRAEAEAEGVIDVRWRDQLHALQHFDAALRLFSFAGLGAEAIDIALQVRHFALLLLKLRLLLGKPGGALLLERAVVAGIFIQALLLDMQDFVHNRIEKVAVVGDQDQRAAVAFQPALQPDNGVEIEVVGRFVEQQQVGTADQRLRQVQAHAPAAGEVADRPLQLLLTKAQTVKQAGGARLYTPGLNRVQLAVQ